MFYRDLISSRKVFGMLQRIRKLSKVEDRKFRSDLLYARAVLLGRISSKRRQYKRNESEVHPPVAATTSGGTPARSKTTAPPILKLCP
jgi:hypothetical protein